ncbi:IS701 family transposase [Paludisphaera mucosa]|uniref:IS701 family transposase n=1 Tax=Paludisphaera mucosa TaxID=3030827 RepID=A0ABT6FDB6_9BACT|nr:IS701 family transposase [Paludisphaera mucosa]MDG3005486.1 IS701 family transposase [Paludisphaera mucosa]
MTPDVLDRLSDYAAAFRDDFNRPRQAAWCGVYLRGLIQDGGRKSVEPMSSRVALPEGLDVADPDQALQQFLGQSTWDERAVLQRYRAAMARKFADPAGIFVVDDATFPKQGGHSVGGQRPYCGALGKTADCQCAVSVHYLAPKGHYPLDMRLYLPDSWLGDPARLAKARVPEAERRSLTKGEIALELLDQARAEGLPGGVVAADSGYGASGSFRDGLADRGLHYVVGVSEEMVVFAEEPRWVEPGPGATGRPRSRPRLADDSPRPTSLKGLAARTPRRKVTWREGTKGPMAGRLACLRVWPASGWATGECAGAGPIWLLIEEQADGALKYAFSNLPSDTSRLQAVRLWRSRWPVELGCQQMKEELGLDHHEGRSRRGFHHHARLELLAFGFLTLERRRARRGRSRPGKKGGAERP